MMIRLVAWVEEQAPMKCLNRKMDGAKKIIPWRMISPQRTTPEWWQGGRITMVEIVY
jgi:hypothetical protein